MAFDSPKTTSVVFTHRRSIDFGLNSTNPRRKKEAMRKLVTKLTACLSGMDGGGDCVIQPNASGAQKAAAAIAQLATGSDTFGTTLNGVSVSTAFDTSDQVTADALVTAINASANALVSNLVKAGQAKRANVALASVAAGDELGVFGYRFTAKSSATGKLGDFDVSGNDTADAAALAAAINAMPGLNRRYHARATTSNVQLYPLFTSSVPSTDVITALKGTGFTITAIAAVAAFAVYAVKPGAEGNMCTIAASGTNASILDSAARLAGGVGGNVAAIVDSF